MNYHPSFALKPIEQAVTKTKIISVGAYLPEKVITSDELLQEINSDQNYGTPIDWMSKKMGIIERRISPSNAQPSSLAIPAAQQAMDQASDVPIDEIDMVVFCGIERDQPEPATAHVIQNSLGLNAKYTFDIANACFGFVNAIEMASQYINSGAIRYALICTGETPSKVLLSIVDELKSGVDQETYRNKLGALSVGDAGGAVIIGASECGSGFETFNTQSISKHIKKCIYKWGPDGKPVGQMFMGAIAVAIVNAHRELFPETLEKLNWESADWMLTHQMGARPFEELTNISGVKPSKMVKTFDLLGNITSATFPVGYKKLLDSGLLKPGEKIGGCFAGSGLAIGQFGYTA